MHPDRTWRPQAFFILCPLDRSILTRIQLWQRRANRDSRVLLAASAAIRPGSAGGLCQIQNDTTTQQRNQKSGRSSSRPMRYPADPGAEFDAQFGLAGRAQRPTRLSKRNQVDGGSNSLVSALAARQRGASARPAQTFGS